MTRKTFSKSDQNFVNLFIALKAIGNSDGFSLCCVGKSFGAVRVRMKKRRRKLNFRRRFFFVSLKNLRVLIGLPIGVFINGYAVFDRQIAAIGKEKPSHRFFCIFRQRFKFIGRNSIVGHFQIGYAAGLLQFI